MSRYLLLLLLLILVVMMVISSSDAFTASSSSTSHRLFRHYMFAADSNESNNSNTPSTTTTAKPLEVVETKAEDETTPTPIIRTSTPVQRPLMTVKNMNTGEIKQVKWVDPAMQAHTNPLEMDWWAYPLLGLPFILLANDALHFIPDDGPLSFFLRF